MAIDPELWQELFTLETVPMCPIGMELAESFLVACGRAVETATVTDDRAGFLKAWNAVSGHANTCDDCREV